MNTVSLHDEPRFAGLSEVTKMATPIILGTLSHTVMQFADQAMVARLGEDALAAIGSAGVWSFTIATFVLGIVGCVSTFVSQSLGRGEKGQCAHYAWQGIYLAIFSGLPALFLWPLSPLLFGLMNHTPEVTALETSYFNIRLCGYVFIAWQASLGAFFQAIRKPIIPTLAAFAANAVNIILDIILIFGFLGFPRMGIAGAAWATVIALLVQTVILQTIFLNNKYNQEFATRTSWALDRVKIRELFRIGWPSGFTFLMDVLNWAVFTSMIVGYFGTFQLAANNIAVAFMHLSFMPVVGLNHAVAPIVGQWIGRGDISRAKSRTYTAMKLAIVYMVTMGIIMAVFGPVLIRLFGFSTDPNVIRLGHMLLIMAATFQAFDAINIVMLGALRGVGDTRYVLWAFIVTGYGFFLPLAVLLAFKFPIPASWGLPIHQIGGGLEAFGAWIGATLFIILLSGILAWRFHFERWRHIRIFEKDRIMLNLADNPTPEPSPQELV